MTNEQLNKELKKLAIKNAKEGIKEVLKGKSKSYSTDLLCMSEVDDILGSENKEGDFDCNSWEWDAWQSYRINGKLYCLYGHGYYGGVRFEFENDEEDEEE